MQGFLFGKLPAFGDFLARGLTVPMRSWWDSWCSAEVLRAQAVFGEDFERRYLATAPRRFLVDPRTDDDPWQAGCLVPSSDRAGRAFPFVLGVRSAVRMDVADGAAVGERLAACFDGAFERNVDLDALVATAEFAARESAGPGRAVLPIAAGQMGWIGEQPNGVEI